MGLLEFFTTHKIANLSDLFLKLLEFYSKKKDTQNNLKDAKATSSGNVSSQTLPAYSSYTNKKANANDDTASIASSSNATAVTDTSGTGTDVCSTKTFEDEPATVTTSIRFVCHDHNNR